MRKKILSVLLALCMVLTLLPIAAYAAELTDAQKQALKDQGYTDEQIANVLVVDEDTVIDADEDRLVIVVGKCTVTVRGAALATGIVVAPGAGDASIVLEAQSNVNAIVVLDKAEVVVQQDAQAANVTVAAPEAAVTVQGTVQTLAVDKAAENAQVTVAETAKVDTVNIDAAGVTAEIKADTQVVLGDNAADVEVKAAEEVNVAVSGNSDALTESSNVGDKADEEKKDDEKKDETTEEPAPVDPGTGPENPGESEKPEEPAKPDQVTPPTSDTKVLAEKSGNQITVTTSATSGTVAVAIPVDGNTYKYYVLKTDQGGKTTGIAESAAKKGSEISGIDGLNADSYYVYVDLTVGSTDKVIISTGDKGDAVAKALADLKTATDKKTQAEADKKTASDKTQGLTDKVTEEQGKLDALNKLKTDKDNADTLKEKLASLADTPNDADLKAAILDLEKKLGIVGENATEIVVDKEAEGETEAVTTVADKLAEVEEAYEGYSADAVKAQEDAVAQATKAVTDNAQEIEDAEAAASAAQEEITENDKSLTDTTAELKKDECTVEFKEPVAEEPGPGGNAGDNNDTPDADPAPTTVGDIEAPNN